MEMLKGGEREQKARTRLLSRNWFDGSIACLPAPTITTTRTAREFRWRSSAHVRRPRFSHFHNSSSHKYYRSGNHRKQQQEKTATETQTEDPTRGATTTRTTRTTTARIESKQRNEGECIFILQQYHLMMILLYSIQKQ